MLLKLVAIAMVLSTSLPNEVGAQESDTKYLQPFDVSLQCVNNEPILSLTNKENYTIEIDSRFIGYGDNLAWKPFQMMRDVDFDFDRMMNEEQNFNRHKVLISPEMTGNGSISKIQLLPNIRHSHRIDLRRHYLLKQNETYVFSLFSWYHETVTEQGKSKVSAISNSVYIRNYKCLEEVDYDRWF